MSHPLLAVTSCPSGPWLCLEGKWIHLGADVTQSQPGTLPHKPTQNSPSKHPLDNTEWELTLNTISRATCAMKLKGSSLLSPALKSSWCDTRVQVKHSHFHRFHPLLGNTFLGGEDLCSSPSHLQGAFPSLVLVCLVSSRLRSSSEDAQKGSNPVTIYTSPLPKTILST